MQYRNTNNTQSIFQSNNLVLTFKILENSILNQTGTTSFRALCPFVLGYSNAPGCLSKLNPDLNWF